jgi:transcription elongation GreA/GreB family factor
MSRAFVREDVDPPERSGRVRSASGLPPGAINYITARGARRLRDELTRVRADRNSSERAAELEAVLNSVTIVKPPEPGSTEPAFGATITVEGPDGANPYTVVGVDELGQEPDAVSWVSPEGKALLAAEFGDRVMVNGESLGRIVKVEYRR